jgi:hypothetical protein
VYCFWYEAFFSYRQHSNDQMETLLVATLYIQILGSKPNKLRAIHRNFTIALPGRDQYHPKWWSSSEPGLKETSGLFKTLRKERQWWTKELNPGLSEFTFFSAFMSNSVPLWLPPYTVERELIQNEVQLCLTVKWPYNVGMFWPLENHPYCGFPKKSQSVVPWPSFHVTLWHRSPDIAPSRSGLPHCRCLLWFFQVTSMRHKEDTVK